MTKVDIRHPSVHRSIRQSEIVDDGPQSGGKVGHMFTSEIFGPDVALVLIVPIIILTLIGLSVWAFADVSSHSKRDFYEAGSSKTTWIIVIAVFTFFYGFGVFIAIYYLIRVRPKVLTIETRPASSQG